MRSSDSKSEITEILIPKVINQSCKSEIKGKMSVCMNCSIQLPISLTENSQSSCHSKKRSFIGGNEVFDWSRLVGRHKNKTTNKNKHISRFY